MERRDPITRGQSPGKARRRRPPFRPSPRPRAGVRREASGGPEAFAQAMRRGDPRHEAGAAGKGGRALCPERRDGFGRIDVPPGPGGNSSSIQMDGCMHPFPAEPPFSGVMGPCESGNMLHLASGSRKRNVDPVRAPCSCTRNAKGARHCCQAPCRRTAAVDPGGSSARFRRHPRLAPARACELRVGRRGRLLSTCPGASCGYQPRRPASSLRPGAADRKPCWMLLPGDRPKPFRTACAGLPVDRSPAGRSFFPGHCLRIVLEPGFRPSVSPFRFKPHLRAALRFRPNRAPASLEASVAPGRHSGSATSGASHPRPVPDAVSRRHQHRFRSV